MNIINYALRTHHRHLNNNKIGDGLQVTNPPLSLAVVRGNTCNYPPLSLAEVRRITCNYPVVVEPSAHTKYR